MKAALKNYLKNIHEMHSRGDAREESFYHSLENLIHDSAAILDKAGIKVTTLPKKSEGGNPDFRVWDGKSKIAGYIEAKKPGTNLDDIERSEQIKRYKDTFPNLISHFPQVEKGFFSELIFSVIFPKSHL
ncbi:MAG: hypothetical protein KAW12_15345, partial [Candidatus Aminicenantes bacterium]|nr:hypothetical protein [Candidatus Aminicenantes bacterium]